MKIENTAKSEGKISEKAAPGLLPQTTKKDRKLHGYG